MVDIAELKRLADGMATGRYVADPSPYHAELLTAVLDELEASRAVVEATRKLDEDGTPTNDWNAIMDAIADYDRVRDGVKP